MIDLFLCIALLALGYVAGLLTAPLIRRYTMPAIDNLRTAVNAQTPVVGQAANILAAPDPNEAAIQALADTVASNTATLQTAIAAASNPPAPAQ